MTVYVIHALRTDLIKIGFTEQPTPIERLLAFRTGCPHQLVVLTYVPGAPRSLERDLHLRFRHQRAPSAGREWFTFTREQRDALVEQLGRPEIPTVDEHFAEKACTPESDYGPVIFGPHTPFAGYLGIYDDEDDAFCREHENLSWDMEDDVDGVRYAAQRALVLKCPKCLVDAACIDIENGYVVVMHGDVRPATEEETFMRPFADAARLHR